VPPGGADLRPLDARRALECDRVGDPVRGDRALLHARELALRRPRIRLSRPLGRICVRYRLATTPAFAAPWRSAKAALVAAASSTSGLRSDVRLIPPRYDARVRGALAEC